MRQALALAAVVAVAGHSSAEMLTFSCHGSVGEDDPAEFIVDVDLASPDITDAGFRWMTTDGDTTIDWSLDRHDDVLRAVILTGPDAGLMISGECDGGPARDSY
jgi:hypothetical protein